MSLVMVLLGLVLPVVRELVTVTKICRTIFLIGCNKDLQNYISYQGWRARYVCGGWLVLMHGVLCSTGWLHSGYLSTLLQTADGHHAGDRAHAERSHVSYSPPFLQQPSWFCSLHSPSSLPGSDVYTLLLPFLVLLSTLFSFFPF